MTFCTDEIANEDHTVSQYFTMSQCHTMSHNFTMSQNGTKCHNVTQFHKNTKEIFLQFCWRKRRSYFWIHSYSGNCLMYHLVTKGFWLCYLNDNIIWFYYILNLLLKTSLGTYSIWLKNWMKTFTLLDQQLDKKINAFETLSITTKYNLL
jgi:hypothetical protein